MIERLRASWRRFKESKPGRRFRDRYHRRQQSGSDKLDLRKILGIAVGVALILAGLFMVIAPGPGWATFFLGLGIIAGEFLLVADLLDRGEVKSRELARRARDIWTSLPALVRVLIFLAILACAAAAVYGAYYVFFGR